MSTIAPQTRISLGTWNIDPAHSTVEFAVKHMMITTVKGRLGNVEGTVRTAGDTGDEWVVDVRIAAESIDTGVEQRDVHLRSGDFLDSVTYPDIVFRSRRVEGTFDEPDDRLRLIGDLTIRGVTHEVVLDAAYEGWGQDPWGGARMSFAAATRIDRRDFDLTWNQALETGGVLVGNEISITLDVQLVKQA